ncbi:MAG: hypothetical protein ACK5H1_01295 [Tenacibaculum sp.]
MKKKFLLLITVLITSCELVFVKDISKREVELLAPANKAEVLSGIVNFNWNLVSDAEQYILQIATPAFVNPNQMVLDTGITSNNFKWELPTGKYEWRVKAMNSGFKTAYTTSTFTIN